MAVRHGALDHAAELPHGPGYASTAGCTHWEKTQRLERGMVLAVPASGTYPPASTRSRARDFILGVLDGEAGAEERGVLYKQLTLTQV